MAAVDDLLATSYGLVHAIRDIIDYPLYLIYSKSLELGILPSDWKLGEVTAIYKKGPTSDRGNYRPVSLTSVCCKLLESLIRDHIMNYLAYLKIASSVLSSMGLLKEGLQCFSYYIWLINGQNV